MGLTEKTISPNPRMKQKWIPSIPAHPKTDAPFGVQNNLYYPHEVQLPQDLNRHPAVKKNSKFYSLSIPHKINFITFYIAVNITTKV